MSPATWRASLAQPLGPFRLRLAALACLVLSWLSLNTLDAPVIRFLAGWPHPWLTTLFDAVNFLGGAEIGYAFFGASLLVLWYRPLGAQRIKTLARSLALGLPAVVATGAFFKWFFSRPRPLLFLEHGSTSFRWFDYAANHTSMPSMHSGRAFCIAVALGWAFPRLRTSALAAAGLVALGRVMVLRHFPSDVLAGAGLALLVMSFLAPRPLPGPAEAPCRVLEKA